MVQLLVSSQEPIGTLHMHSSPLLQLHVEGVPLKLSRVSSYILYNLWFKAIGFLLANRKWDSTKKKTRLSDWSLQTVWHWSILRFRFFIFFFRDLRLAPLFFLFFFMTSSSKSSSSTSSSSSSVRRSFFELRSNFKIVFTCSYHVVWGHSWSLSVFLGSYTV